MGGGFTWVLPRGYRSDLGIDWRWGRRGFRGSNRPPGIFFPVYQPQATVIAKIRISWQIHAAARTVPQEQRSTILAESSPFTVGGLAPIAVQILPSTGISQAGGDTCDGGNDYRADFLSFGTFFIG